MYTFAPNRLSDKATSVRFDSRRLGKLRNPAFGVGVARPNKVRTACYPSYDDAAWAAEALNADSTTYGTAEADHDCKVARTMSVGEYHALMTEAAEIMAPPAIEVEDDDTEYADASEWPAWTDEGTWEVTEAPGRPVGEPAASEAPSIEWRAVECQGEAVAVMLSGIDANDLNAAGEMARELVSWDPFLKRCAWLIDGPMVAMLDRRPGQTIAFDGITYLSRETLRAAGIDLGR